MTNKDPRINVLQFREWTHEERLIAIAGLIGRIDFRPGGLVKRPLSTMDAITAAKLVCPRSTEFLNDNAAMIQDFINNQQGYK